MATAADIARPVGYTSNPHPEITLGDERLAVGEAISFVFGDLGENEAGETGMVRSTIVSSSAVGGHDDPEGIIAYLTRPDTGTLILAEGRGSDVAAAVTTLGFDRAAQVNDMRHLPDSKHAVTSVQIALTDVVRATQTAQELLASDAEDTDASALVSQLVGANMLAYAGHRPLIVVGPDGRYEWPTHGSSVEAPAAGVLYMQTGRNVIVMSSGRTSDAELETFIDDGKLHDAITARGDDIDADALAEYLQQALLTEDSAGTIMISVVDVAPWKDRRSPVRRAADFIRPSPYAYWLANKVMFSGRHQRRRELYNTQSDWGRAGRIMSRVADVALNTSVLLLVANIAKSPSLPIASSVAHALDWLGGAFAPVHGSTSGAATPLEHSVDSGHSPSIDASAHREADGTDLQPSAQLADTYPANRVAEAIDPVSGRAANISDWSKQAIIHYGQQENLTEAQIHQLLDDPRAINTVNNGFIDDPRSNNPKVSQDSPLLNENDAYSLVDQNTAAHNAVLELKHKLGLDTPPPAQIDAPPIKPPAELPALPLVTLRQPTSPYGINHDAMLWATASVSAASLATAGVVVSRRRRQRRKQGPALATVPGHRSHGNGKHHRQLVRQGAMPAGKRRPNAGRRDQIASGPIKNQRLSGYAAPPARAQPQPTPTPVPLQRGQAGGAPNPFSEWT